MTDVEVVDRAAVPTVAVRVVVPMADLDVGALFGEQTRRLADRLASAGAAPAGPAYARYHEFGPDRADIELGFPLAAPLPGLAPLAESAPGDVGTSELPGGRLATLLHVGPYPELGRSYAQLEAWVKENGMYAAGAPWESYLVMPDEVDGDAARLRTEVCWPVA